MTDADSSAGPDNSGATGPVATGPKVTTSPSAAAGTSAWAGVVVFFGAAFFAGAAVVFGFAGVFRAVDLAVGFADGCASEDGATASPGEEDAAGLVVARGVRGLLVEAERVAVFFAVGGVSSPAVFVALAEVLGERVAGFFAMGEAPSPAALGTSAEVFGERDAGFFFAGGPDWGFAAAPSLAITEAPAAISPDPAASPWASAEVLPESFNCSEIGTLFCGSSGVSSGEAGGTIVTDLTYQLTVADSRRMSF